MWIGGLFIGIKKQIAAVSVARVCVLVRSERTLGDERVATDAERWQSAWRKSDYTRIFHTSKSFPFLYCAACFLFPVDLHSFIVSLPRLLQLPLYFAQAPWHIHPWHGRASLPARLQLSLGLPFSICLLPFYVLPKGFPTSTALETSWGDAIFQLCLLPWLFSLFFFLLFLFFLYFFFPFFWPHGMTLTDFWWVTGSTGESTWWWWFHCASDL